jgi:hypothetical protein
MRFTSRLSAGVVALATIAFVGGGGKPAASALTFAPQATPPVLPGDVFHYAGTSVDTSTAAGQKPVVTKSAENLSIAATGNATFDKRTGLTRLQYVYAGLNETFYEYVGFPAAGAVMQERVYGVTLTSKTSTDDSVVTTTYPVGEVLDEYPEAAGLRWNPAAQSISIGKDNGKSGTSEGDFIINADGSYNDSISADSGGFKSAFTNTLDSTGTATIVTEQTDENKGKTTYGLPVKAKSGFAIPVTTAGGNALPAKPAPAKTIDVPDWFPSHDLASRPLEDASIVNEGVVSTPAACGVRARVRAFDLHGTETTLDPLAGTYEIDVYDEYDAASLGNVCAIETDTTYSYDNGPPDGTGTGKLTNTDKTVSVTILTSESGPKPLFAIAGGSAPFSLDVRHPRKHGMFQIPR